MPDSVAQEAQTKTCSRCKRELPIDSFLRRTGRKTGRLSRCTPCRSMNHADWAAKNPDNSSRRRNLLMKYGLTLEAYDLLLEKQGGGCGLCGQQERRTAVSPFLSVDHDHETGQVRGLLCHSCNTGLGHFDDNPELLRRAAAWVERD